jgi:hypothetical protein
MTKILQRTRKLPQLGQIMISCQFCADLLAPGNSAPLMCNLTAQHRLTQIPPASEWLPTLQYFLFSFFNFFLKTNIFVLFIYILIRFYIFLL